ncbi:YkgJ family cysteine cluster protein [Halobacteriovorax marinus]|uniref:YkgJ family cysteine cluster protein n=1 Tax=Halobacteriovorax marinus TaxID=97084 RepID=UPI003A93164F
MLKIMNDLIKKLRKLSSPARRARLVHKEINKRVESLFKDPAVAKNVSCRQGCSACCHTQVSISDDESQLLKKLIDNGHEIDIEKLKRQSKASKSSSTWYRLSYEERACIFLDKNKSCSIYEHRPSVCRTNYVVGDPSDCSTEDGLEKSVRLLNTHEADMALMAGFSQCEENGAMPDLLYSLLEGNRDVLDLMSPQKSFDPVFKEF